MAERKKIETQFAFQFSLIVWVANLEFPAMPMSSLSIYSAFVASLVFVHSNCSSSACPATVTPQVCRWDHLTIYQQDWIQKSIVEEKEVRLAGLLATAYIFDENFRLCIHNPDYPDLWEKVHSVIILSDPKVNEHNIAPLFRLKNIRKLTMSRTGLKTVPEGMGELTNLRELHLGNNPLLVDFKQLGCLPNLQQLHLEHMEHLSTAVREELEQLVRARNNQLKIFYYSYLKPRPSCAPHDLVEPPYET